LWGKEVAQGGIDMAERPGWIGNIAGVDVMTSNEAKTDVLQWNGWDLANIDVSTRWTSVSRKSRKNNLPSTLVSRQGFSYCG